MIEEVLERIVGALEERNALQKRMVECAEWQVKRLSHLGSMEDAADTPEAPVAPAEAPVAPAEAPAAPEAEDAPLDREALLKECKELGVEVPAKTRTTTLAKLVAEARVKVPEAIKAEEAALEEEMENSVNPDPAPAKPLTSVEARAILNKEYDGSERDRNILREALKCVNVTKFCEVQDGQFDEVVRVFRVIKKEAVKNG